MQSPFSECLERIEGLRVINFVKQDMPDDDFKVVAHYNDRCKLAFYINYPIQAVNMQEGDIVTGSVYKSSKTNERLVVLVINDYAYIGRHKSAVELFSQVLDDKEARVTIQ